MEENRTTIQQSTPAGEEGEEGEGEEEGPLKKKRRKMNSAEIEKIMNAKSSHDWEAREASHVTITCRSHDTHHISAGRVGERGAVFHTAGEEGEHGGETGLHSGAPCPRLSMSAGEGGRLQQVRVGGCSR